MGDRHLNDLGGHSPNWQNTPGACVRQRSSPTRMWWTPTAVCCFYYESCYVIFQQDNAIPHTALIATASVRSPIVQVLPWPSYSPELNPIGPLSDTVPTHALQAKWLTSKRVIRTLISSMDMSNSQYLELMLDTWYSEFSWNNNYHLPCNVFILDMCPVCNVITHQVFWFVINVLHPTTTREQCHWYPPQRLILVNKYHK